MILGVRNKLFGAELVSQMQRRLLPTKYPVIMADPSIHCHLNTQEQVAIYGYSVSAQMAA